MVAAKGKLKTGPKLALGDCGTQQIGSKSFYFEDERVKESTCDSVNANTTSTRGKLMPSRMRTAPANRGVIPRNASLSKSNINVLEKTKVMHGSSVKTNTTRRALADVSNVQGPGLRHEVHDHSKSVKGAERKVELISRERMSGTSSTTKGRKAHLVLVHGAGGGGWCWYKIRCLMETCGYKVSCLDLKGAGVNPSDPNTVVTLEDYHRPLFNFLSNLPEDEDEDEDENEKVVLVGHSARGMAVTDAIHSFAQVAVYVAATMLKHGFSTEQDRIHGEPDLSEFGEVNKFEYGVDGADESPTGLIIKQEFQRQIMYHMSPREDSTLASMLLRPTPVRALRSARFTEGKDVDFEPRVYIKAMYDRVLKPEQQDVMIDRWLPSEVFVLETDHSPFFSSPSVLCDLLIKAASINQK